MTTEPTTPTAQAEAIKMAIAEIGRLRNAMFATYAAAQNGASYAELLGHIERERNEYEAGYCVPELRAILTRTGATK